MLKFLISLIFMLSLLPAPAQAQVPVSFERAIAAFEAGEHDSARTAFDRMAKAGFTEAQFNLGAMLLNGQGGEAELVDGAAWIRVAAENGYQPALDTVDALREQLDADRLAEIDSRAVALIADHGRQTLLERYRPRAADPATESAAEDAQFQSSTERRRGRDINRIVTTIGGSRVQLDMEAPRYPRSAAENRIMGLVQLAAWIEPTGEISHAHVVSAYPEGVFDRGALHAYARIQAKWLDEPPSQAQYIPRSIIFTLDGLRGGPIVSELKGGLEAHEGDLAAQYRLVWLTEQMTLDGIDPIDPDTVIEVTHQAALAGVIGAQVDLARQLRQGVKLEQDADGANFWLKQAAFEGDAHAAFELSRSECLDQAFRRDLRHAAIEQGHLSALLTEIRELVENPDQASAEDMAALLEQLPHDFRRSPRDPVLTQARQIAAG